MKRTASLALCLVVFVIALPAATAAAFIDVELPTSAGAAEQGRLLVFLAPLDEAPNQEPRELATVAGTVAVFGVDVENWRPGSTRRIDATARGYPFTELGQLPPGEYRVQALLNRYETLNLADGRALLLPLDRGEGQQWRDKPGNWVSVPERLRWDGRAAASKIRLTKKLPEFQAFTETPWIKHIKVRSERLSKFWGRDIYLGALVTLPAGYNERPQARYPLVIRHGRFPLAPAGWREQPPDPHLPADYSARFEISGYNRIEQQYAWQFFQEWNSSALPRVLLVEIQHSTPFHEMSYGVNSANNGPYGDAIQYELIPEIERRFRGLGAGWARFVFGGSNGGWAALAAQIFYPEHYNGAWVACPDPIDFRHFGVIDIYRDRNAYHVNRGPLQIGRPARRNLHGHIDSTILQHALFEQTVASRGRSSEQWDAWEAVFSPVGSDGYPRRLWNRSTGEIDPVTAEYWREHHDLGHILRRDWPVLAGKLRGKLRLHVGHMDDYYLNNAVYAVEEFLRTAQPAADAVFEYGERAGHCWNGGRDLGIAYSRLRYPQLVLPWVLERILASAPPGADLSSWRY